MTRYLCISGTDTGVGKTIVTAALAGACAALGLRVHVDKPVQTGVAPGEPGDVDHVATLTGLAGVSEGIRLREPMAPVPAAAGDGLRLPSVAEHAARLRSIAADVDLMLVEGSGGLLVQLDEAGATIADLARALGSLPEAPLAPGPASMPRPAGPGAASRRPPNDPPTTAAQLVVVTRAGLGTLNHTELTLEAAAHRALPILGLVIGSWPPSPAAVEVTNRAHLAGLGPPLLGVIPEGAGSWDAVRFRAGLPTWLPGLPAALGTGAGDTLPGRHAGGNTGEPACAEPDPLNARSPG